MAGISYATMRREINVRANIVILKCDACGKENRITEINLSGK